ncbi:sulfur oxidation c-type cytochrome SoxA [Polynucleobacter sp. AM-7D1]|uniref:sulfur oxidation c-type cytochrome SoxA n=1 Tax=Polynucleobacter sp. AM-7D1 TaxID=2689102 RepID=UPI00203CE86A|nr:sulfur oxidation c-type cytochrome SoxA [Polynucleobacter sp. AM-7D1]QWE29351.1 sulfur oxidation c-type cytochrome SoxA [Polynucleobacter sp. AM-7D1]
MNLFIFCCRVLPILAILLGVDSSLAEPAKDVRQSSYQLMTPENQAMQDDPNLNPALFWVMDGHSLWKENTGKKNVSCASCHGDSSRKMVGVATQFPKVQKGKLQTLEGQINQCRTSRQEAPTFAYESKELLALTTFVATQSKGLPIAIQETPQNKKDLQEGRQIFHERMGQLNLSCAQCHQDRAGLKLGGSLIPQGHPTAYPIYRIEWQTMGSLQRRLRNCMSGVRAKQFEYGSKEMAQLELFLIWRARGMPLETPGVRP